MNLEMPTSNGPFLPDVFLPLCIIGMIFLYYNVPEEGEPSIWLGIFLLILIIVTTIVTVKSSKHALLWTIGPPLLMMSIFIVASGAHAEVIRSGTVSNSQTNSQTVRHFLVWGAGILAYELVAVPVFVCRRIKYSHFKNILSGDTMLVGLERVKKFPAKLTPAALTVASDFSKGIKSGVRLGRSVGFRLVAFELLFFGLILAMTPTVFLHSSGFIMLFGLLLVPFFGLIVLFFWQIISGSLKLWTDLWRRATPPNPAPLNTEIEGSDELRVWNTFYKSESDIDPPNIGHVLRAIWQSIALLGVLLLLGVGIYGLFYANMIFELPLLDLMFRMGRIVAEKLLIWYEPGIEALTYFGVNSQNARIYIGLFSLAIPSGLIIANNLIHYVEDILYTSYFEYSLLGKVQFILATIFLQVTLVSGALVSILQG